MRRSSGDNALCFKNLEQEISKHPEKYECIDLLCAGWPCQDNSIAGKRTGHKGERSGLWSELVRLIGLFYPKWLILENVPGLFSVRESQDFKDVLTDLDQMSYCVAVKVLDSQYFGVAQRRKRVFIVGSFGNIGASKVFLEQEGGNRNIKKSEKIKSAKSWCCITAHDGGRYVPTVEKFVAYTVGTTDFTGQTGTRNRNIVASTIRGQDADQPQQRRKNFVASTIGATPRGNTSFIWQDTYIAETDTNRKGKIARTPKGLDTCRGIVIGNAVTVPVVEWIAKRIYNL